MLRIILGHGLDGGACPDVLLGKAAVAGIQTVGPSGFLHRLELMLGIPSLSSLEPVRVARFVRALEEVDDGNQFFSSSFRTDAWRTARKLLLLRDELFLAGWNRHASTRSSKGARLKFFGEVEECSDRLDKGAFSSGTPDRLQKILDRLERISPGISHLELVDPERAFPVLWQRIFKKLVDRGTEVIERSSVLVGSFQTASDLDLARKALDPSATIEQGVTGDGSLLRLKARSLAEAAEGTAAVIRELVGKREPETIVLIRDGEPRTHLFLESALLRQGVPLPGLVSRSAYRPMGQVLPLLLELAWEPVDPDLLVQFLSLSESPIPRRLRRALLRALHEAPGYRSRTWVAKVEELVEELRKQRGDEAADKALTAMADWIDGIERVPSGAELRIEVARTLARKVEEWAGKKVFVVHEGEKKFDPVARAVQDQARLFQSMLELHPREAVSRLDLRRMMQDVLDTGIQLDLGTREVGAIQVVADPGAIIGEVSTVIWWQCVGSSAKVPGPSFWTENEVAALKEDDCLLQDPKSLLLAEAERWARPIRCARDQVILVQPEQVFSDAQESHPLWNELAMRIAPEDADQHRLSIDAERLLKTESPLAVKVVGRVATGLPRPKIGWLVDPQHVQPRKKESPSSLEWLLACPLRWTMRYKAKLREPLIQVLPEGNLFYGNLAHRLFSEYFDNHDGEVLNPEEASREIGRLFDESLPREAAPLLRCGMERERTFVRVKIVEAMGELIRRLCESDYRVESTEATYSGSIGSVAFEGRLDLVLKRERDGNQAILDLKWSGVGSKRLALQKGSALQLAAYSHLVKGASDPWPPTGYFILPAPGLFSTHTNEFPGCTVVEGPAEPIVWGSIERSHDAVRRDLDRGNVIAPFVDREERKHPSGFGDEGIRLQAPCRYCNYRTFCGAGKD